LGFCNFVFLGLEFLPVAGALLFLEQI